jgi:hypothetical protein
MQAVSDASRGCCGDELEGQYRIPDPEQCMQFTQIATDVGLLTFAINRDSLALWPAKRRELNVDFTKIQDGTPTHKGWPSLLDNRLIFEVERGSAGADIEWLINGKSFDLLHEAISLKNKAGLPGGHSTEEQLAPWSSRSSDRRPCFLRHTRPRPRHSFKPSVQKVRDSAIVKDDNGGRGGKDDGAGHE